MAAQYPNFYENLDEANRRLLKTIVLYDGRPYYIPAIVEHPDGIIRVYLDTIRISGLPREERLEIPLPKGHPELREWMDAWMEKHPGRLLRKHINSPKFNKFRPFPLGMCNVGGHAYYLERQPLRQGEQGLTRPHVCEDQVSLNPASGSRMNRLVEIYSKEFEDCVLGNYPSIDEAIKRLRDTDVLTTSVGFGRHLALIKGPVDMWFLAYKTYVLGHLPNQNLSEVRLGREYGWARELISDSKLFNNVL